MSNADLVREALAAFAARDERGLLSRLDPDVEWHPVSSVWGREYEGHDGVRRWLAEVEEVWDSLAIDIAEISEHDGGRLLCSGTLRGRPRGAEHETSLPTASVLWMRDRLIGRVDFFITRAEALAALEPDA